MKLRASRWEGGSVRSRRGFGLAGVLAVMVVAALAAFTMAAITTAHAHRAQRQVNQLAARYLAEGAIARAIGKLRQDPMYGMMSAKPRGGNNWTVLPSTETLTYGSDARQAVVAFGAGVASRIHLPGMAVPGVPYSTNNLVKPHPMISGMGSLVGSGGLTVKPRTVHLAATAVADGQRQVVEVLVGVPQFPYVVCTTGRVMAPGTLVCKAASSAQSFLAEPSLTRTESAASVGAVLGVSVDGDCEISGDVVARDSESVRLPEQASIGGIVRSGEVRLPELNIDAFDPQRLIPGLKPSTFSVLGAAGATANVWDSRHYDPAGGTLHVVGDLNLMGALLFVNGSVDIEGGLKGRGMLVATGDVFVRGAVELASLRSDQVVALVAKGDVRLEGRGARSCFQGLVCANGAFTASNLTIAGVFMSGLGYISKPEAAPTTTLSNVTAVYLPEAANLSQYPGKLKDLVTDYNSSPSFPNGVYSGEWLAPDGTILYPMHSFLSLRLGYAAQTLGHRILSSVQARLGGAPGPLPQARAYVEHSDLGSNLRFTPLRGNLDAWPDIPYVSYDNEKRYTASWLGLSLPKALFNGESWSLVIRRRSRILVEMHLPDGSIVPVRGNLELGLAAAKGGVPRLRMVPSTATPYARYPESGTTIFGTVPTALGRCRAYLVKDARLADGSVLRKNFNSDKSEGIFASSSSSNLERWDPRHPACTYDLFACGDSALFNTWLAAAGVTIEQLDEQQTHVEQLMCDEYNKAVDEVYSQGAPDLPALSADLNEFYGTEKPLRIISWQEHE